MKAEVRAELIKQFPAAVVELTEESGKTYYVCPTCKRAITLEQQKCTGCSQVFNWEHIRQEQERLGTAIATMSFEVPGDFAKGDCRKCPLSYIAKEKHENVYECPLKMRANCKLSIS